MKFPIRLCVLHLFVTLAWTEKNTTTDLWKHHARELQNQLSAGKQAKFDSNSGKIKLRPFAARGNNRDDHKENDSELWISDHGKNHLLTINGGKGAPCQGKSCLWSRKITSSRSLRHHRHRRTNSAFLAKALNLLDRSKPRELWNFVTRATPDKPYKQFSNGTEATSDRSLNITTVRTRKPVQNQSGSKRQQSLWSDLEREMRPRFFFNSAPAEYVEQKPSSLRTPEESRTHLRQGPIHMHEPFIHGENNHLHLLKHPGHLSALSFNVFGRPQHHNPVPLAFHSRQSHMHHFAPPPPYALHIDAPPRLEPPMPPNVIPPPVPPVDAPPPIPPEVTGEQIPPFDHPLSGPPLPPDVPMIPPPNGPIITHPAMDSSVMSEGMSPDIIAPPDVPLSQQPIDVQGIPSPGDMPPMPPPPRVQQIPIPVPVPSPPKVKHVPYPVPVPGPPSIQPIMVPVRVPSPPKIQEIAVPVPSPPKVRNVPVPVPVEVPSPPQLQRIPFPVPVAVKEPPEIQKIFFPIAVPQPAEVRHVPFPVYVRYPPEIKRVPFPVPSPPKPVPVPVPSPPQVMVHRVPIPVMYPQKVPFPVPVVVDHHHIHQGVNNNRGNT